MGTATKKIKSREYKMMLKHRWFQPKRKAVNTLWNEVVELTDTVIAATGCERFAIEGDFESPQKREITFFDTTDHLLRRSGLVFRRRIEADGKRQFTLKARNEDRYIASGFDLMEGNRVDGKAKGKFEEDIGAPFRSRFSKSNTVRFKSNSASPFGDEPKILKDAALLFPILGTLIYGGKMAKGTTKLTPVNGINAYERVYKGPKVTIDETTTGTAAAILWTNGWEGRPLVAEFSFRLKDEAKTESFPANISRTARQFFELIQSLDWCKPDSATKTQYVYRESVS